MQAASSVPKAAHRSGRGKKPPSTAIGPKVAPSQKRRSLQTAATPEKKPKHESHLSNSSFADLNVSAESKKAIAEMGFERMTLVQAATLPPILKGEDVLAKAKTGTGKTVAFMLPVIEKIAAMKKSGIPVKSISCLVITPTRELSLQVESDSRDLSKFHKSIGLACVVGGLSKSKDLKKFSQTLDILIATPGRLEDHLNTTDGFAERFKNLKMLIFDEADRMLDMGFRDVLSKIISYLPRARQTLLFSATYPKQFDSLTAFAFSRKDYTVVDTVGEEDTQTNVQVEQESLIVPLEFQAHALYYLLNDHIEEVKAAKENYKVMVFFPTARIVSFWAQFFNELGISVLEMHSRKSQAQRGNLVEQFKNSTNTIMFTSDVTARGMDFDGVTLIIQSGLTEKEQYIHRLGRTARAGKTGKGVLLLSSFESRFLQKLNDLPIKPLDAQSFLKRGEAPPVTSLLKQIESKPQLRESAATAYITFLGFYKGQTKPLGKSLDELITTANSFSSCIGLSELPEIEAKTVGKMGLKSFSSRLRIKREQTNFRDKRGQR